MLNQVQTPMNFKAEAYPVNYNKRYTPPMSDGALDQGVNDLFLMQEMQNQKAEKKAKKKEAWYKTGVCAQVGLAIAFGIMAATSVLTYRLQAGKLSLGGDKMLNFKKFAKDALPALESDSVNPKTRDFVNLIKKRNTMNKEIAQYAGTKSSEQAVLFYGPSGTGKTFSAKLMANELGAEYAEVDFPKLSSKFIGETSVNIKKIFEELDAKAKAEPKKKFLVAFNEIDAMLIPMEKGGEHHSILENRTAFLNGLDLVKGLENVKIVGTTNARPNKGELDSAAMSRFGNLFEIELPTKKEVVAALKWHLRDCKAATDHKFFDNNTAAINSFADELVKKKFSQRDVEKLAENAQTRFGIALEGKTNFASEKFDMKYLKEALKAKGETTAALKESASKKTPEAPQKLNLWQKIAILMS